MSDDKPRKKGTWAPGTSGNPSGKRKYKKLDGWESAMTAIGSSVDKRGSFSIAPASTDLSYQTCIDIYERDDLGRRAAEDPIMDAFRQGYEISMPEGDYDDLKADIEDEMRRLQVDQVVKKALIQKRVLGGSIILLGVRDNKTMDRPLDRSKITKIDFLSNLEPMDLVPYKYYEDPLAEKFGDVELWELRTSARMGITRGPLAVKTSSTAKQSKSIYIHESRLVIFNQDMISKYTTSTNPISYYWGLSIYTLMYEILRDFNISWSAAGLLVTDFSQAVFSIDNLMSLVARDPDGLRARMQAMNMGRSVANVVLTDTKENFERKSTNVSGLPDLLEQLSRRLMAAIKIPLSVIMGGARQSASSEVGDELRYYYDGLAAMQRDEIGPIIHMFVDIIMRGMRQRGLPKKWCIKWHPLWQLTDEQKANARLAQARVDAIYIQYGVLDPTTVARIRFGGEYSFDTVLTSSYESPGFMAIAPTGTLVDGMDPKTGLPPGVQPDPGVTGAHAVKPYVRRDPRQTSNKGKDPTAGGATPGKPMNKDEAEALREEHGEGCACMLCLDAVDTLKENP